MSQQKIYTKRKKSL